MVDARVLGPQAGIHLYNMRHGILHHLSPDRSLGGGNDAMTILVGENLQYRNFIVEV